MWSIFGSSKRRRKELLISAIGLLLLNLLIHLDILRPPYAEESTQNGGNFEVDDQAFQNAFLDAFEALEYMYQSQLGRAKVAETVERAFDVEEVHRCSGHGQTHSSSRKWLQSGEFFLFSAYLDRRPNLHLFPSLPTVRILASSFGTVTLNQTYFCHFRIYNRKDGTSWRGNVVRAHNRWIWQRAWDPRNEFYNSFLLSCPLLNLPVSDGSDEDLTIFVRISKSRFCINSDTANYIKIVDNTVKNVVINTISVLRLKPSEIRIAVCVKGLAFLDESELSARWLLEWVELQWALGATSVCIYVYWVPDNVRRMLESMAKAGRIEFIYLDLPRNSPNQAFNRHQFIWRNRQQKRRHELIPYNDCFYRHSPIHHFVLIIDTDEVVIPTRGKSWQQMLANVLERNWHTEPTSISIKNVFKIEGNISRRSLFDHKLRSAVVQEPDQYGKSFISTRSVASVFNHFALHRLHANVSKTYFVDEDEALKLHWKAKCPDFELGSELCRKIENNFIEDNLLKPYKEMVELAINSSYSYT